MEVTPPLTASKKPPRSTPTDHNMELMPEEARKGSFFTLILLVVYQATLITQRFLSMHIVI